VHLIPARLVDALPASLWSLGNLHMRGNLHFCYGGVAERTVEWNGREIGRGRDLRLEEMEAHSG
jgi:hypothetical protein